MVVKTNLDIGERVWLIHYNRVTEAVVWHIEISVYKDDVRARYGLQTLQGGMLKDMHKSERLYKSKEALLQSL